MPDPPPVTTATLPFNERDIPFLLAPEFCLGPIEGRPEAAKLDRALDGDISTARAAFPAAEQAGTPTGSPPLSQTGPAGRPVYESVGTLGGLGKAHDFHSPHQDPGPAKRKIDDRLTYISWPNVHSGAKGTDESEPKIIDAFLCKRRRLRSQSASG